MLNAIKTELLNLPHDYYDFPDIFIDNIKISSSQKNKYLVIIIDRKLYFYDHIFNVCKKANVHLYNIQIINIRNFLTRNLTYMITKSLIISTTNYYNSLYQGLPKNL